MRNILIIYSLAFLLAGCGNGDDRIVTDQCMRSEIFVRCMKILPKGPESTHYNDWDDVVKACEDAAYYQSRRRVSVVKLECRSS